MKIAIVVLIAIIAILAISMTVQRKQYEKLVEAQDEVCYALISDAREKLNYMSAMGLVSNEDYKHQMDSLISYAERLITDGNWGLFIKRKAREEGEK